MNYTKLLVLGAAVLVFPVATLYAQNEVVTEEAVPTLYTEEGVTDMDVLVAPIDDATDTELLPEDIMDAEGGDSVVGVDADGELTAEEYEDMTESSEVLTDEVLSELDLLTGEIVAVNEEEGTAIVEDEDGSQYVVELSELQRVTGGGGTLLNPKPGDTFVLSSPEVTEHAGEVQVDTAANGTKVVTVFIVVDGKQENVQTANVPVFRNGERSTVASLAASDTVRVAKNEAQEVVAIYAEGSDEVATSTDEVAETGISAWYWIAGLVLILGLGFVLLRKREQPMP